jgi:excisionase family DNA binding protein
MIYQQRIVTFETREYQPDELMTMAEAARRLGRSLSAVRANVEAGRLSLIIDLGKAWGGRRLVLRREVEEWAEKRG